MINIHVSYNDSGGWRQMLYNPTLNLFLPGYLKLKRPDRETFDLQRLCVFMCYEHINVEDQRELHHHMLFSSQYPSLPVSSTTTRLAPSHLSALKNTGVLVVVRVVPCAGTRINLHTWCGVSLSHHQGRPNTSRLRKTSKNPSLNI